MKDVKKPRDADSIPDAKPEVAAEDVAMYFGTPAKQVRVPAHCVADYTERGWKRMDGKPAAKG